MRLHSSTCLSYLFAVPFWSYNLHVWIQKFTISSPTAVRNYSGQCRGPGTRHTSATCDRGCFVNVQTFKVSTRRCLLGQNRNILKDLLCHCWTMRRNFLEDLCLKILNSQLFCCITIYSTQTLKKPKSRTGMSLRAYEARTFWNEKSLVVSRFKFKGKKKTLIRKIWRLGGLWISQNSCLLHRLVHRLSQGLQARIANAWRRAIRERGEWWERAQSAESDGKWTRATGNEADRVLQS